MKKIGVIGKGFVGSAVAQGFSPHSGYEADVKIYDKDPSRTINTLDEVVNGSEFVFISVPTPSNSDGSINLDIVLDCINSIDEEISEEAAKKKYIPFKIYNSSRNIKSYSRQVPEVKVCFQS